jgi:betaine-aldehyde dehydrogenase
MGPVVSDEHRAKVERYIKIGIEEGANLVLGGKRPTEPPYDKGYFVMPTIFTGVKQNMTISREEIFGPVACIMEPFSSEEEVIELANDNIFGLCSYIWTKNTSKGIRVASKMQSGTISVNKNIPSFSGELPWGGVKQSGFGKEGSRYGLEEYTQLKFITMDTSF